MARQYIAMVINDGRQITQDNKKEITVSCPEIFGYNENKKPIESFPIEPLSDLLPVPYSGEYVLLEEILTRDYVDNNQDNKTIYKYTPYYRLVKGEKVFYNEIIKNEDFSKSDRYCIGGNNRNYFAITDEKETKDENFLKIFIKNKEDNNEKDSLLRINDSGNVLIKGGDLQITFDENKIEIKNNDFSLNQMLFELIEIIMNQKTMTSLGPSGLMGSDILALYNLKNNLKKILKGG